MEQAVNGQLVNNTAAPQQLPSDINSQPVGRSYQLTEVERSVFVEQATLLMQLQRGALALLARQHGMVNARLSEDFKTMMETQG